MKKALIIGACGFVGGYLAEQLQSGFEVCGTKLKEEIWTLPDIPSYDLDILDKEAVEALLKEIRPDYIVHLAAQSSVSLSWRNPGLTIDVNVKGSVNLLEAVRTLDAPPRVLMIGSGEEYGYVREEELPIREENPLRPGNIYAATKVSQNLLAGIYAKAYGLDVIMVRAFNHVGPRQSEAFVVSDFCRQVARIEAGLAEPVIRVGNLSAERDFTDVRDVVRAYDLLLRHGEKGETYNVGSGRAIPIREILERILSCSKVKIKILEDPERMRPADVPVIVANHDKLTLATGWQPEYDLSRTIQDTIDFWRMKLQRERGN